MNRQNFRKKIDQLWQKLQATVDQINRRSNNIVLKC
jgi:frataxin-like iron-binding protein CyaY